LKGYTYETSNMQAIIVLLVALATNIFAIYFPPQPQSDGCLKIAGISQLPLKKTSHCDKRNPCNIIAPGGICVSTILDRVKEVGSSPDFNAKTYPIMTCASSRCTAQKAPKGFTSESIQCTKATVKDAKACGCPPRSTAVYSCGVCNSPGTSICFCCTLPVNPLLRTMPMR